MSEDKIDVSSEIAKQARVDLYDKMSTPAEVATDSGSVKQHSLGDQIKALEYFDKREAAKTAPVKRIAFARIIR